MAETFVYKDIEDGKALTDGNKVLKAVSPLLQQRMPEDGPGLIQHLTEIDAHLFTCHHYAALMWAKYRMKGGAKGGDKGINIFRMVAEMLEGAADSIENRVMLGQSILRYLTKEISAGLKG